VEAKCFNCNRRAEFDIDKNKVICERCDIIIDYDEYIEKMKEKALNMSDDFQLDWDKSGF
jgi:hypothetical protein